MPKQRAPAGAGSLTTLERSDLVWIALFAVLFGIVAIRNWALGLIEFQQLHLGPLTLSPFGLLVALDLLFAYYLIERWCVRFDLDWAELAPGLVWIAALGIFVCHLFSVAFYFPEDLSNPIALLDVRTRLSSFGGFLGGSLVAVAYLRRRGLPVWLYSDPLAYGFVGGYVFGRLGCFSIHDHPGTLTGLPWGIEMFGARRHDLGLYEMVLMLALLIGIHVLARRGRPPEGRVVAFVVLIYMPVRFLFDFLRIDDARYAGLTPAQWFAIPFFLVGVWALVHSRRAQE
jgi:phosphatidylglycerol---prolipoprotein diacylglyceryl transferase